MTTLFAEMWVVKARNALDDEPLAGGHSRGSLSSKPHLGEEGGGQPVVLVTAREASSGALNRLERSVGGAGGSNWPGRRSATRSWRSTSRL
jgi:hypothetical protein